MVNRKTRLLGIVAGASLILLGAALTICAMPVFSYVTEQVEQVKKSEIIMNYSFSIHQSRDKMVQTQLSTGQKLKE
jgi:uncharacterized membrane protein